MTRTDEILGELARRGLLLKQDKLVPSVVGILTGEVLSTSWWSHPKGRLIFAVLSELADHPDVLVTKLLYRKDTLVHRSLWPALLAVGESREEWQMRDLSVAARELLARLDREGLVQASGVAVKELEVKLLATAQQVHTASGRHEIALESWRTWSARVGCETLQPLQHARQVIEGAATRLGMPPKALPWSIRTTEGG